MKEHTPPTLRSRFGTPLLIGFSVVALLLVAIPLSQYLSTDPEPPVPPQDPNVLPPPDMIEPPPDPPEPDEPQIDNLKDPPLPPSIEMMEFQLEGVDTGGLGGYTDVTLPASDWEDPFVDWKDLTIPPKAIQQPTPQYPPEAKRLRINGEVIVQFLVTPEGRTKSIRIVQSSNPIFNDNTIAAIRKWLFTPGEKDGRIVTTRAQIKIPFQVK